MTVSAAPLVRDLVLWPQRIPSHFGLLAAEVLDSTFIYIVAALHTQAMTLVSLVKLLKLLMSGIFFYYRTSRCSTDLGLVFFSTRAAFQVLAFVSFDLSRDWRHWHCSGRWSTLVSFHLSSGQCCCETLSSELIYLFILYLADFVGQSSTDRFRNSGPFCHAIFNRCGLLDHSNSVWSGNRSCLFGLLPARSDCPADGTNIRLVFDCVFQCTF